MKLSAWMAGVLIVTGGVVLADEAKAPAPKGEARAAALLAEAARSRYTWSPNITGVSGKCQWNLDGKTGTATFQTVLHQRDGFKMTAEGGGSVPDDVSEHVESMINHRVPPSGNAGNRTPAAAVIVVEDETGGPLIMTLNDRFHSTQRVKNGKLVQVNRKMGGKRFTIDVTRFVDAGHGKSYPADFTVTWWNAATGKLLEKQTYTTRGFYHSAGQLFPKAEKVVSNKDGKARTLELEYSDIKFRE